MDVDRQTQRHRCHTCLDRQSRFFDFTMAFQPIVNVQTREIFAYEALVRGVNNEPASTILALVDEHTRYWFDQACRFCAVQLASELKMPTYLSINFLPNAVYKAETCIRATIEACKRFDFPLERIIFEITEGEKVTDLDHLQNIIREYRRQGFQIAMDDFGAGYSGLNLLADLHTDFIKLDMALIRDIDQDKKRQAIVRGILQVCRDLEIGAIAEGVETRAELDALRQLDIHLFQGYYFARPAFRALSTIDPAVFAEV